MHGLKWIKTENYAAKLDSMEQLFDFTGSNKNNVRPIEAVQDVYGPKRTKKNVMERNLTLRSNCLTRGCKTRKNVSSDEDLQDLHGLKWTKRERYGAKLDATEQLFDLTGSNKNNFRPKEAVQDVY